MKNTDFIIMKNMGMASDQYSLPVYLGQHWGCSFHSTFTGSHDGSLKLQVCNDIGVIGNDGSISELTNWTDYTGSAQTINMAGTLAWDVTATAFRWMRVAWVKNVGSTGTLNARAMLKGI
jgi:hypothetical protein